MKSKLGKLMLELHRSDGTWTFSRGTGCFGPKGERRDEWSYFTLGAFIVDICKRRGLPREAPIGPPKLRGK